jgi:putative membrane protein
VVFLKPTERAALDAQLERLHAATGIRVLAAEIGKADTYEELAWRAFALGASLAGLAVVALDALPAHPWGPLPTLVATVIPLAVGALAALLAVLVPAFARLLLHTARAELEVSQYAQALFLRHEWFNTPGRDAVLLLLSRFERRVHILPDTGLAATLGAAECRAVIERMKPALRAGRSAEALQTGLLALQETLVRAGRRGNAGARGDPPDAVIEEPGA